MENLHPNITLEIFSRLPDESLVLCKQVCKTWRTLLLHKTKVGLLFSIGLHGEKGNNVQLGYGELRRRIVDDEINNINHKPYEKLTWVDHPSIDKRDEIDAIVGSCNGLVCFSIPYDDIDDPVYICNPTTKEYVHLPTLHRTEIPAFNEIEDDHEPTLNRRRGRRMVNGFGYHPSTNEYKVVRIYYANHQNYSLGRVQVYTLGCRSGWREIGFVTHELHSSPGILANGALHWMDYRKLKIVAFDLADEKFRLLPSPPCFLLDRPMRILAYKLQVLGGNLSVIHQEPWALSVVHQEPYRVDIWILKENSNSDVKEQDQYHYQSWSREFSIAKDNHHCEPFALTESNEVLLWYNRTILSCYNPETKTLKKIVNVGTGFKHFQAIPHIKSSVSLKALGERSRIRKYSDQLIEGLEEELPFNQD
ncbi:F-box associated domain [Macleaya cordata]|uniref:F-box associated domain n=1 Tax=Macleaya cordata TaxID=56857 RepID=A0A200R1Z9_MACCD|nr:F-box associated domain [Macleaya cordata]